jgi:hypothetical protein
MSSRYRIRYDHITQSIPTINQSAHDFSNIFRYLWSEIRPEVKRFVMTHEFHFESVSFFRPNYIRSKILFFTASPVSSVCNVSRVRYPSQVPHRVVKYVTVDMIDVSSIQTVVLDECYTYHAVDEHVHFVGV